MKNKKTVGIIFLAAILSILGVGAYAFNSLNENASDLELIRFHVLANSDSPQDQELKLKVRDRVIADMEEKLKFSTSIEETRDILMKNMDFMKNTAKEVVGDNNSSYDVEVMLGDFSFPTRKYGDVVLAAGKYEALRIVIGEGEGQNWWCVMFPPLCFIDIKNGLVDEATRRELKNVLSEEEYQIVSTVDDNKELSLQLRSKIWDILKASRDQIYRLATRP